MLSGRVISGNSVSGKLAIYSLYSLVISTCKLSILWFTSLDKSLRALVMYSIIDVLIRDALCSTASNTYLVVATSSVPSTNPHKG